MVGLKKKEFPLCPRCLKLPGHREQPLLNEIRSVETNQKNEIVTELMYYDCAVCGTIVVKIKGDSSIPDIGHTDYGLGICGTEIMSF